MKKLLVLAMVLSSIIYVSCTKSVEGDEDKLGSIYGIVTELGTSDPMKAVGVELYKAGNLLMKTVTFDDGHFEFTSLNSGSYQVKVVADEYEQTEEGHVAVEAGRQARIDLQVRTTVGRIYGVITYAGTDTPVADAEIDLFSYERNSPNAWEGPLHLAKVYSDKDGNYHIDHLKPEKVILKAKKDNYESPEDIGGYGIHFNVHAGEALQVNLQLSKK